MSFQTKKFSSIVASMISWCSSATDKVTDFNVGSVIRTLIESVALELEELYYQLLKAVEEAIEEAIYRAFNFPRNPAEKSTGNVRFTRQTGSEVEVTISSGVLISTDTEPSILFETQADDVIPIFSSHVDVSGSAIHLQTHDNFVTIGIVVGSVIKKTSEAPLGESVVTSITTTTLPNDTLNFAALTNSATFVAGGDFLAIALYKDIPVRALAAGIGGNVAADSVILLKSNTPNIISVTNPAAFSDGREEETDFERKERFAKYIGSLTRATRNALEYAALTIPEIVSAKAIDDIRATCLVYQAGTSKYTDISLGMRNPGDSAVNLFPPADVNGDMLYIGAEDIFTYINFHLITPGVLSVDPGVGTQYWNGAWTELTGIVDETNVFTQSGCFSFTPPTDWTMCSVNGLLRFWLRRYIDTHSFDTTPTGDWCSLPPGFGYVYLYCHDGSGDLSSSLKTMVESAVELYRACGISVIVSAPTKMQPVITVTLFVYENYDATDISSKVQQNIIDFLNTKKLGEDLYVAELYQFIMGTYDLAIANCTISALYMGAVPGVGDIYVPGGSVIRPDLLKTTVTATSISV